MTLVKSVRKNNEYLIFSLLFSLTLSCTVCSLQFRHLSQANVLLCILGVAQLSVPGIRTAVEPINVAMLAVAGCAWIGYQVRSKQKMLGTTFHSSLVTIWKYCAPDLDVNFCLTYYEMANASRLVAH